MQKIFKLNKNKKVEFTKEELNKLLDEVYNTGYNDGKTSSYVWQSPYKINDNFWYSTTTPLTPNSITITSQGAKSND